MYFLFIGLFKCFLECFTFLACLDTCNVYYYIFICTAISPLNAVPVWDRIGSSIIEWLCILRILSRLVFAFLCLVCVLPINEHAFIWLAVLLPWGFDIFAKHSSKPKSFGKRSVCEMISCMRVSLIWKVLVIVGGFISTLYMVSLISKRKTFNNSVYLHIKEYVK